MNALLVESAKILFHNMKVGKTSTIHGKVSVSKSLNLREFEANGKVSCKIARNILGCI